VRTTFSTSTSGPIQFSDGEQIFLTWRAVSPGQYRAPEAQRACSSSPDAVGAVTSPAAASLPNRKITDPENGAMRFYAPIAKVDADERMVWGYASTEAEDDQGEIITREALARALADYLKFANIREMHQMSAVGVAEQATVDDRGLYVGARIIDRGAWDKVRSGVYKGFSVGGRVTSRDPSDRNIITGLSLTEISLVDRPANPEAVFDCWKAERSDPAHADPGLQPDGRPRYPLDDERHIRAAWAFIHMPDNAAAYTADELARIKARIVAAWKQRIDPAGPPAAAGKASRRRGEDQNALDDLHDRLTSLTDGECCKNAKAAGRHSATTLRHLQAAHDALCRAGAHCDGPAGTAAEDEEDFDKAAGAGALLKAFAGEIMPRLDALAKRVEEVAAIPLPPVTAARAATAIAKREDGGGGLPAEDVVIALARMSEEERTLALIKAAHANPIMPFGRR
jgi:phage head maturation protease